MELLLWLKQKKLFTRFAAEKLRFLCEQGTKTFKNNTFFSLTLKKKKLKRQTLLLGLLL